MLDRVPVRADIQRITKKKTVGNRKVLLFLTRTENLARLPTGKRTLMEVLLRLNKDFSSAIIIS